MELAWIPEHEEDIASDLSVFHRIDDPDQLPAPLYFLRAERLMAYEGAVRLGLRRELASMSTPAARPVVASPDVASIAATTQGHGQGFPTIGYRK